MSPIALISLLLHGGFLVTYLVALTQRFQRIRTNQLLVLLNVALITVWATLLFAYVAYTWPRYDGMPAHTMFLTRPDGPPVIMWIFRNFSVCLALILGLLIAAFIYARWRIRRSAPKA